MNLETNVNWLFGVTVSVISYNVAWIEGTEKTIDFGGATDVLSIVLFCFFKHNSLQFGTFEWLLYVSYIDIAFTQISKEMFVTDNILIRLVHIWHTFFGICNQDHLYLYLYLTTICVVWFWIREKPWK